MSGLRFLPWVRAGLSAGFPSAASLPARGQVTVTAVLGADGAGVTVPGEIATFGPGDVLGLDGEQVIRRFPAPDTDGAETTGFACVELDNPDAPWAFTTGGPDGDGRLRPWLVLVVVPAPPADVTRKADHPLPVLTCPQSELPDLSESWAWAHAQLAVSNDAEGPEGALAATERSLSRIIAPRRLIPGADYVAALVPAFEAGRLAGLGLPLDEHEAGDLADAWDHTSGEPVDLPVYDTWRFSTGMGGDFETLVRRIEPRAVPETVGQRAMFVGAADPGLPVVAEDAPGGVLGLEGALRAPTSRPTAWPAPERSAHRAAMRGLLGHPERLTPPLYGSGHAGTDRVPADGSGPEWLRELNLDPRHRVAAGLGARVVRDHQEELAEAAWSQAASLRQANDLLRRAQLARAVSEQLHQRRLTEEGPGRPLSQAEVLALTAPVSRFVPLTPRSGQSVGALVDANPGLAAVSSPAFRRVARPHGPVARRAGAAALTPPVQGLAATTITKAPTLDPPAGTVQLPALAEESVPIALKTVTQAYIQKLVPWWQLQSGAAAPPIVEAPTKIVSPPGVFLFDDRFFAASEDGRLFEVRFIGGTWVWRDHGRPPGGNAASSVSAAIGRRVYVATADGRLCSLYWDGDRWLWQDHDRPSGTYVTTSGAAAAGASVFVTCTNGSMAELRPDLPGTWRWVDHGRIPRYPVGPIWWPSQSAVGRPGGVINGSVFTISNLGELWELSLATGTYTWVRHGFPDGGLIPDVGPSFQSSKLFVTTQKGDLWERYLGSSGWQWVPHGRPSQGAVVSPSGAPMLGSKQFVRVSDGGVAERVWNGSAYVWVYHGKPPSGAHVIAQPDAAVQAHTFFCAASDGHLWGRTYVANAWQWVDHGIPKDSGGQGSVSAQPPAEERWAPRLAMFGSAVVAHLDNPAGANRVHHRVGRDLGLDGTVAGGWIPAGNPHPGPVLGPEGRGLGIAIGDITGTGRPDLVVLTVEPATGGCDARYWIGTDLDANGVPTGWLGPKSLHSQLNSLVTEADIALADLDGDGRPELVLAYAVSAPGAATRLYYRVGWRLDASGNVSDGWSESKPIPWEAIGTVRGLGVDVADLDDDDRADLAVLVVEDAGGADRARVRVGHTLNRRGNVVGGWTEPRPIGGPPIAPRHAGAGLSIVDITGSRKPDLVVLLLADPQYDNQGRVRIGFDADATGQARVWSGDQVVPHWFGWENQGAALCVYDLDPALVQRRAAMGSAFTSASAAHQAYLAPAQSLARAAREQVVDVAQTATRLVTALDPATTIPAATLGRIVVGGRALPERAPGSAASDVTADPLRPVVRHVSFPQPTYELLRRVGQEHIVPGVEHIPAETMTLLRANPAFIEAFLVGLNHELSRELLWREVPVDLRTTWFRQFWDVRGTEAGTPDIPPLTSWGGPLGSHATGVGASGEGNLVLAVRGELLRRYPSTTVAMRPAVWADDARTRRDLGPQDQEVAPIFSGWLSPDLLLFGFPLSVAMARGSGAAPGWFIVLREQATAVRFGVDDPPDDRTRWATPPGHWSDLHWAHLVGPDGVSTARFLPTTGTSVGALTLDGATYGRNGAHVARALLQQPVEIAVHAARMLGPLLDGWRITGIERTDGHIVALHGEHADPGSTWRLTVDEVADAAAHGDRFYVQIGSRRTPIVVVDRADGRRYVRTRGDAEGPNNLLALPEVSPR
ncbi:DUF3892 domain-containing protein [Humibacillus xanthopallidus]|uniref:DUF3892 domain-containing protein n=1 Tax=Humibacillus xanthopallidus TaxID=412689 RepID=UPI00384A6DCA